MNGTTHTSPKRVYVRCCEAWVDADDAIGFWYDATDHRFGRVHLCKVGRGCEIEGVGDE